MFGHIVEWETTNQIVIWLITKRYEYCKDVQQVQQLQYVQKVNNQERYAKKHIRKSVSKDASKQASQPVL